MVGQLFKIKQGDLRPYLEGQLVRLTETGEVDGPQDLSGATVVFTMQNNDTKDIVVDEQTAVILDPLTGMVQYQWQDGDTDIPGKYFGEFEATFGDEPETFPNGKIGFDIKITAQLR